jgi:hypothetical protein
MLNKLVIVPGGTTVQQNNEHEKMCESMHASTLTHIFFRSSKQKTVHTLKPSDLISSLSPNILNIAYPKG